MDTIESTILPHDQILIERGLFEIVTILRSMNILYILEGGTLLGAVREKRFLPWDDDVGIAVAAEQLVPIRKKLKKRFIDAGFVVGKCDNTYNNCKINVIKDGARYEILGWYLKGR